MDVVSEIMNGTIFEFNYIFKSVMQDISLCFRVLLFKSVKGFTYLHRTSHAPQLPCLLRGNHETNMYNDRKLVGLLCLWFILFSCSTFLIPQKTLQSCFVVTLYILIVWKRWKGISSKISSLRIYYFMKHPLLRQPMSYWTCPLLEINSAGTHVLFAQNHIAICLVCGKSLMRRYYQCCGYWHLRGKYVF